MSKLGFDAIVGNPPWVSYAGKAARPIQPHTRDYYEKAFESFAGFRNLQGLFVERSALMLRVRGRLGLLIPSSMSEQQGYAPTRRAHDQLCDCDLELPDIGDGEFSGVFQPCMVLRSTRRAEDHEIGDDVAEWPIERPDLDADSTALIKQMTAGAPLPPTLFGERGLQTSGNDETHLVEQRVSPSDVALRNGRDIEEFARGAPSQFADRSWFGARLRSPEEWTTVRVLIRQTARFPIAALSDGRAFRNTILAGFETEQYPATFLVAYLNSTAIRWIHYKSHRDARHGMPQMKIGHLRDVPAPLRSDVVAALTKIGESLSRRNTGVTFLERQQIDDLVADSFALSAKQRSILQRWDVDK